ncbi:MAG: sugar phosphate nucleotidyltransferase [bacterium]|nr:sugar phosphate nucleotidyltransferase [bacterium]
MQCVILAAGRGTRMRELTRALPKPLLEVRGKTLLEHKFDALPDDVDEIVLVIGYLGSMIQKRFGNSYEGKKITYVEQDSLHGTAAALWSASGILHGRFIVMMGDDLYGKKDVGRACKADRSGVGTCRRSDTWLVFGMDLEQLNGAGKIIVSNGTVVGIIESDEHGTSGLASTNLFSLDVRLFEYEMIPKRRGSEEYGLPQTVLAASKVSGIPLELARAGSWIQITAPEDLKYAEKILENSAA